MQAQECAVHSRSQAPAAREAKTSVKMARLACSRRGMNDEAARFEMSDDLLDDGGTAHQIQYAMLVARLVNKIEEKSD
jgi:hypothetical protein